MFVLARRAELDLSHLPSALQPRGRPTASAEPLMTNHPGSRYGSCHGSLHRTWFGSRCEVTAWVLTRVNARVRSKVTARIICRGHGMRHVHWLWHGSRYWSRDGSRYWSRDGSRQRSRHGSTTVVGNWPGNVASVEYRPWLSFLHGSQATVPTVV